MCGRDVSVCVWSVSWYSVPARPSVRSSGRDSADDVHVV